MRLLKPDCVFEGIQYIDFEFLKSKNLQGILLDIDNTLIDMSKKLEEPILNWVKKAKEKGFKVAILSNSNKLNKIIPISQALEIDYISFAKKPAKSGYLRAAKLLDLPPNNICMIGDQVLTDVWGANKVNMFSIYVKPINKKEYWYTAWKRPIESMILKHFGF